jgi:hypothetical protein
VRTKTARRSLRLQFARRRLAGNFGLGDSSGPRFAQYDGLHLSQIWASLYDSRAAPRNVTEAYPVNCAEPSARAYHSRSPPGSASMTLWPCLYCVSGKCIQKHKPIPLPFAMPPQPISHPELWPNGRNWLYVACPECRQVSAHSHWVPVYFPDVRSRPHANKLWLRISLLCGVEDCNTPVQFHVLVAPTITETTESKWREKLRSGYWTRACPCGHPTSITSDQAVVFERIRGILLGYNPSHPLWKQI